MTSSTSTRSVVNVLATDAVFPQKAKLFFVRQRRKYVSRTSMMHYKVCVPFPRHVYLLSTGAVAVAECQATRRILDSVFHILRDMRKVQSNMNILRRLTCPQ